LTSHNNMEPIKAIEITKTYNASPEVVWQAWTDPTQLKQWWGPENVSIPEVTVDLKVGGQFYIVMEAGEAMGPYKGTLWPMMAQFTVVQPHSQLAYTAQAWTEGAKDETTIDQTTEISFAEDAGKTTVTVKAAIYKTGPKAGMAAEGMQMGFTQQLAKLDTFLASK
jgi:uncharacterized protein YndB with AHSA1/START domain